MTKKKIPSLFEIIAKSIVEHFCKICRDVEKSPCCHQFHDEAVIQYMAEHFKDLRNLIPCGQKEARWSTYFMDAFEEDDNEVEDEVEYWFWLCFENSEAQELKLCLPTKSSQMIFTHIQRSRFQLFNAKKLDIHMEISELNLDTSDEKGQNAMRKQSMMTALVPTVHEFRYFFKKFPNIEELDICIDAGATTQADLLCKVFLRLNKLRRLKIALFEDEFEQFAKFIDLSKSRKTLTQIELSNSKSDTDLNETVFASLMKLPNLASLSIWGHSISESAIKHIKNLRLDSLRHLVVDENSSELMKLEETFPNVQKIELLVDEYVEPFVDFDKSNFCKEKLKRVTINCFDYPLDSLFFKNFPNIETLELNVDEQPNFSNLGETEVKSLKKLTVYETLVDEPKFLLKFPNLEEFYVGIDLDEDFDGLSETDLQNCNDFVKKLLPYLPEKCQIFDSFHKEKLSWCRKTSKLVIK